MKRSVMVKKVQELLDDLYGHCSNTEDDASKFLKELEDLGMLPPAVEILSDHYNRNEGRMGFDSNEWESED